MSLLKKKKKGKGPGPDDHQLAQFPPGANPETYLRPPGGPSSIQGSVAMTISKYEEALDTLAKENESLLATVAELMAQRDREGVVSSRVETVKTQLGENKVLLQTLIEAILRVEKEQVMEITMLRKEAEMQRSMLDRLTGSGKDGKKSIWERIGGQT